MVFIISNLSSNIKHVGTLSIFIGTRYKRALATVDKIKICSITEFIYSAHKSKKNFGNVSMFVGTRNKRALESSMLCHLLYWSILLTSNVV